jgi:hypothetical protein
MADESDPRSLCPLHGTEAAEICDRCGRFVCAACLRVHSHARLCAECDARPEVRLAATPRARRALGFAVAGFHGVLPLLLIAGWMARAELAAVGRGEAPAASRPYAQVALGLAFAGVAIWGVVLAAVIQRIG